MTKQELVNLLKSKEICVKFLKKDKSERLMRCTLQPGVVPQTFGKSAVPSNPEHLIVYDTEKEAWRTLNLENKWELVL